METMVKNNISAHPVFSVCSLRQTSRAAAANVNIKITMSDLAPDPTGKLERAALLHVIKNESDQTKQGKTEKENSLLRLAS